MAIKLSTKLCNSLLGTAALSGSFSTPELRFYSGSVPASADASAAAMSGYAVIATVKQAGGALTFGTAASGVLTKGATAWTDASAVGGVATYYRLVSHADDDAITAGVYPRIQGTVGTGAADMNLTSTTIAAALFTVNYWEVSIVPT